MYRHILHFCLVKSLLHCISNFVVNFVEVGAVWQLSFCHNQESCIPVELEHSFAET